MKSIKWRRFNDLGDGSYSSLFSEAQFVLPESMADKQDYSVMWEVEGSLSKELKQNFNLKGKLKSFV